EGIRVPAWPALVDEGEGVALRLFDRPEAALASHRSGVAALARLRLGPALRYLEKNMPLARDLGLLYAPLGRWDVLRADLLEAVLARLFLAEPLPRDRASFESRLEEGRGRLMEVAEQVARAVHNALMEWKALWPLLQTEVPEPRRAVVADLRTQVEWLMQPRFVARTPDPWLSRIGIYLKGARLRLEKLSGRLARDAQWQASVNHWMKRWADLPVTTDRERLARRETLRWLIEEYRLSLFAQELGTVTRVSEKRLEEMLSVCR
ncbi:MAG TPA: DUF3418 domain-containing protein, partial [Candidatus Macondimonas sp.]|nr:DUF3418 domain-containing protein [Candidatus Macondimonas sp.]